MDRQVPSRKQLQRAAAFRLGLRRFHAASDRVVRSHGLTPRQYLLLLTVESWEGDTPPTIGDLVKALELVPSTMTELLERGEQASLLRRTQADDDGRRFFVRTTAEGRRRLIRAFWALEDERRAVARTAQTLLEDG